MAASSARRQRRRLIVRKARRVSAAALTMAGVALAASQLTLERSPRLIVPVNKIERAALWKPAAPAIWRAGDRPMLGILPGMFPAAASLGQSAIPILSYIEVLTSTSNGPTVSFTGVNLGAAAADRLVVIGVTAFRGSAGNNSRTISSATIAGAEAAIVVQNTSAAQGVTVAIISAVVPTGATGTVSITFSGTVNGPNISVFTITGLTSTTVDGGNAMATSLTGSGTSATATFNVPAGACVVGIGASFANTSTTWSGTAGLTEMNDGVVASSTYSAASASGHAGGASLTATATFGSSNRRQVAAAAFR